MRDADQWRRDRDGGTSVAYWRGEDNWLRLLTTVMHDGEKGGNDMQEGKFMRKWRMGRQRKHREREMGRGKAYHVELRRWDSLATKALGGEAAASSTKPN